MKIINIVHNHCARVGIGFIAAAIYERFHFVEKQCIFHSYNEPFRYYQVVLRLLRLISSQS